MMIYQFYPLHYYKFSFQPLCLNPTTTSAATPTRTPRRKSGTATRSPTRFSPLMTSSTSPTHANGSFDNATDNSTESSTINAINNCNSSILGGDNRFPSNIIFRSLLLRIFKELCEGQHRFRCNIEHQATSLLASCYTVEDKLKTVLHCSCQRGAQRRRRRRDKDEGERGIIL